MSTPYVIVFTTASDRSSAREIGRALLDERLAACVQLLPIESMYNWKGEVSSEDELLLIVKTTAHHYAEVEATIRALHSYELPEIVAVPIDHGLPAYLGWIDEVTRRGDLTR